MIFRELTDQVKIENIAGDQINPATNEKLDELKLVLDTIDANTDTLETKTQSIRDQLDVLLSSRSSELTSQSILDALGVGSGTNILNELQNLTIDTTDLAKEDTLIEIRNYLDTVEVKLQSIIDKLDVNLSTRASEASVSAIKDTIGEESGSTVLSKLTDLKNAIDNLELTVDNVNINTDELEDKVQSVKDQLDVLLSSRSSEATSTAILNTIGEESGNTILSKLQNIWDKLVSLFNDGVAKVKLWDGTNQVNVTSDNKLETITYGRGKCSTLNSTTVSLGANQSFLGTWEEVLDYSMVCILILSDQNSASNGLIIEWSCDGNYVEQTDSFSILANAGKTFTFGALGKYVRIRYINGNIPQTLFRLQVLLKPFHQKASSHKINDIIVTEDDAELVKAVITGQSDGTFVNVKVDSAGRLQTVTPAEAFTYNIPIQLSVHKTLTAVNTGEWQEVVEYTVPIGYDLSCIAFDGWSNVANERIKAVFKTFFGSYNCLTNTFTDGDSLILPKFNAKMYVYVTSPIGAGGNDLITITYTNQDGITGRTSTVTIPKSSPIGTRLETTLQTDDIGIIDITNVTHSQLGQTGTFNIEGNLGLFYLVLSSANVGYFSPAPSLGSIIVAQGGKIYLQYKANSLVANERRLNLTGTLVPR